MKLAAKITFLDRLINVFNHKEKHITNTTNNFVKYNYWDQECLEHPTNNSCLLYCD